MRQPALACRLVPYLQAIQIQQLKAVSVHKKWFYSPNFFAQGEAPLLHLFKRREQSLVIQKT